MKARPLLPVVVGVAAAVVDVLGDSVVRALDRQVDLVGPYLRLTPSTNDGVAFGLLQGTGPLPAILGIVGVAVILAAARRSADELLLRLALGFMLGGAAANLLERLVSGAVLDYIDMGIGTMRWPTYNLSDVAISLAVLLLIATAGRVRRASDDP